MGQSAVQELTRILRGMRARGVRSVWLSDANISALAMPLRRYSSTASATPNISMQAAPPVQPPPVQPPPAMRQSPSVPPAVPRQMPVAPAPSVAPKAQTAPVPTELGPQIAAMDEEQLTKAMMDCHYCPYGGTCNKKMLYAGAPKPKILFVGEFPSAAECEGNSPFASPAGQMLYKMGTAMGLSWENAPQGKGVGLLNILKCRPDSMAPRPEAVAVCSMYVMRQIELAEPSALVLMGALAVKVLCPTEKRSFSLVEGNLLDCRGIISIPIKHPNMIMRFANQQNLFFAERKKAWNSLQKLMQMVF
ncbi:MAG: uracil-DNA glycosylase [Victivallales bacterium]|nr:uracil-DNA glycosylase [Victivallales bacterium]